MPDLCVEKMDISGEFQNFVVTNRLVQRCTRNFSTLVELTGTIEWLLQAMHYTMELLCTQEVGYCVETCRGIPLCYISAIYSTLAVIKRRVKLAT